MKLSYAIIIALRYITLTHSISYRLMLNSAIVSSLPTLEASDGLTAQPALSDSEVVSISRVSGIIGEVAHNV